MKKFLSAALCFIIIAGIFAAVPFGFSAETAPDSVTGDNDYVFTYRVENNEAVITGVSSDSDESITIPESINGYSVTSIDTWAFSNCSGITDITIPDSVKSIGKEAFYKAEDLKAVIMGKGLKEIPESCFFECRDLETVSIGENVETIEEYAFYRCDMLKTVDWGYSLISIKNSAFNSCTSLDSITLPDTIQYIEAQAFSSCTSMKYVYFPKSLEKIGENAFRYCSALRDVYYEGSKAEFDIITIEAGNEDLTSETTFHFNRKSSEAFSTPSGITAQKTSVQGDIRITWEDIPGCVSYQVFYKREGWTSWKKCKGTASDNYYTDKGCTNNVIYYYTVRCLYNGEFASDYDPIGARIQYLFYDRPEIIKAEPTGTKGNILITWEKVPGCNTYQVFYRREGWTSWKKCKGTTSDVYYTDKGCTSGITYYYTVRCLDEKGNFASTYDSNGMRINYFYLKTPVNVKATAYDSNGRIKITWGRVSGASKYQVYFRRSTQNEWYRCNGYAYSNIYIDKGCSSGVTYFYTVRACDSKGNIMSDCELPGAEITYTG